MINKIIETMNTIQILKLIPRMGWKLRGVKDCESVADHSFRVIILSMLLGDLMDDIDINKEKLIKMASLHELCESITLDMPNTVVDIIGKDKKFDAELFSMNQIFEGLPEKLKTEYINLWKEFEGCETTESKIVKFADKFEMMIQAYEYEKTGYKNLQDFWDNKENFNTYGIDLFQELLDKLYEIRVL